MPPRNQDQRGGTATRQADRDGSAAKASELAGKATPDLPALIRAELAAAMADLAKPRPAIMCGTSAN